MALRIVQNSIVSNQQVSNSKEGGIRMSGREFNQFLDSFIRDHYTYRDGSYYLNVFDLDNNDLEEFAAQLIKLDSFNKEGWEWLLQDIYQDEIACQFASCLLSYGDRQKEAKEDFLESLTKAAIKVLKPRMKELVDDRIDQIWHEDMQEMGRTLCHHRDNGEPYYT